MVLTKPLWAKYTLLLAQARSTLYSMRPALSLFPPVAPKAKRSALLFGKLMKLAKGSRVAA